jgi:vancomycin resistance protein YoaR
VSLLLALIVAVSYGVSWHSSAVLWLDDMPVSALREGEVNIAVRDWWNRYKGRPVTVIVSDRLFDVTVEQLGFRVDIEATVAEIRKIKKTPFWQLRRDYKSRRVTPVARLEGPELDAAFDDWEQRAIASRPTNPELGYEHGSVVVHPGQSGLVIDRHAARRMIQDALTEINGEPLNLPLSKVEPSPDSKTLDLLRESAEQLAKSPIVLESKQPPIKSTLLRSDLGRLLRIQNEGNRSFKVVFDADTLVLLLRARHVPLDVPAKNATLAVSQGNHFVVVPESPGYHIDASKLAVRLLQTASDSMKRGTIDVDMGEPAKIKAADVEHLGIRELMGSFTTRHACCQPRVTNIHRIADLLDGVIVLPGETFSVNDTVGPRSTARGFVMAPSIEDGEMVETIGGGVSQFATTFYNALLRAGLEIVERRAHTYWFDRYPMGHEATLSIPKPDLVFRNDTKSGVLIKTESTEKTITVKLYGDMEGRKVAFGVSGMQEVEQPTVERLPNPDIAPDKEHTRSAGRIGWSVMTWRTVTLANGEQKKDERKVTYRPQVRRVEVHPCRLKPEEPGYTGEACPKVETEDELGETN